MTRAASVRGPGIDEGRPVFSIYATGQGFGIPQHLGSLGVAASAWHCLAHNCFAHGKRRKDPVAVLRSTHIVRGLVLIVSSLPSHFQTILDCKGLQTSNWHEHVSTFM